MMVDHDPIREAQAEEHEHGLTDEQFRSLTQAMREADEAHQTSGGGTRHYLRECFFPALERHGLAVRPAAEREHTAQLREALEWFYQDRSAIHNDHGTLNHCEGCRLAHAALAAGGETPPEGQT